MLHICSEASGEGGCLFIIIINLLCSNRNCFSSASKTGNLLLYVLADNCFLNNILCVTMQHQLKEQWQKNPQPQKQSSHVFLGAQQSCSHSIYFPVMPWSWHCPHQQVKATEIFQAAANERYVNYSQTGVRKVQGQVPFSAPLWQISGQGLPFLFKQWRPSNTEKPKHWNCDLAGSTELCTTDCLLLPAQ